VGTIVVYSAFEGTLLRALAAEGVPFAGEASDKLALSAFDLLECVRANVYHPAFNGSFSIKNVLPALVPELSHADLPIHDGDTASLRYLEMQGFRPTLQSADQIATNLLEYCCLDTLAMVKIFDCLLTESGL
jgi:hypothetical protein